RRPARPVSPLKPRRVEPTMAIATPSTAHPKPAGHGGHAPVPTHAAPVSPGKGAMWLFLATEGMFFTGLIGSYIVLRAGSSPAAYSNIFPPGTPLQRLGDAKGVVIKTVPSETHPIEEILRTEAGLKPEQAEMIVGAVPHGVVPGLPAKKAEAL